jgi:hypothetical protein
MTTILDPRGMTWDYWCALMSETYAANQLGTVPEDQWKAWADAMSGIGRFVGIPDSRYFDQWQEWAYAFNNAFQNTPRK